MCGMQTIVRILCKDAPLILATKKQMTPWPHPSTMFLNQTWCLADVPICIHPYYDGWSLGYNMGHIDLQEWRVDY